jgi:hypothetical protein
MIFKKSNTELINVLEETNDYLKKYDNISWQGLNPAEASMDLEIAIEQLRSRQKIDRNHLKMLFAPTGLIQECALANNWEIQYLKLSEKFDGLIKK